MIPQGTGWQYLRGLSLDAIPRGTKVFHTRAVPLHAWRSQGAFTVLACTKSEITIETAGTEIGSVLLADAEHLLDHAAEHRATVYDALKSGNWYSPAWVLVTTYYWSFFSALALTRLTGHTVWFLDRAALRDMRTLAGAAVQPSAGALYLNVEPFVSATTREISLKPSKSQLHDALWRTTHGLIQNVSAQTNQNANGSEYRLWWSLARVAQLWGPDWPSKVRNAVNYRPGSCYREIVRRNRVDTMQRVRLGTPFEFTDLMELIEDDVLKIGTATAPNDALQFSSGLLGLFAIALSSLVEYLHADLILRQAGDQRWRELRRRFFTERCATATGSVWPVS